MVSVDGSLIIQIVNFLALIFILNAILYKPIRKILTQRKEKINGLEQGIENLHQESDEQDTALKNGMKEARVKGMQEKDALMQEASDREKEIIGEINAKANAQLKAVRDRISTEKGEVKSALLKDVDAFAAAISEKILGRTV